jgi:pimeloyl-ACP methyl ester carboxylesterase
VSATADALRMRFEPVDVPLWREALFGFDWLSLRMSPVYYGIGVPRGDGSGVVVIPGFLGSDNYLIELYYWLRRIGYRPYYSRIGRNAECPDILTERLFETIDKAHADTGRPVHLLGHSLGGLLARSAASRRPEHVSQVICLAAPFRDIRVHPMILAAAGFVRGRIVNQRRDEKQVDRGCYTGACTCQFAESVRADLPVSISRAAIYTKTDGVVDWRSCIEEDEAVNYRVDGTHSGLAFNPQAFRQIAKLLAGEKSGQRRKRATARTK